MTQSIPIVLSIFSIVSGFFLVEVHAKNNSALISVSRYIDDISALQRAKGFPDAKIRAFTPRVSQAMPHGSAKSVLVIARDNDQILGSLNPHTQIPIASITKLATVLTFLELDTQLNTTIVITHADVVDERSGLKAGDRVSIKDLLGLTLISSSNTAAKVLQRASGLSYEYFVGRMNIFAQTLGMSKTVFVDPTGISPKNISTAYDVYHLLIAASRSNVISAYARAPFFEFSNGSEIKRVKATDDFTTGKVLFSGELRAAKTGYVPEGGFHFALLGRDKAGNERVVVVLGAEDSRARFIEANALFEWSITQ